MLASSSLGDCTKGGDPSLRLLQPLPVTTDTGEKPQSKLWHHGGRWWSVLPDEHGTHLWRLDDPTWTRMMTLATRSDYRADCLSEGDTTFVLLFAGPEAELVTLAYEHEQGARGKYETLSDGFGRSRVDVSGSAETATIARDASGRLWLASDTSDAIEVRHTDPPYTHWSAPFSIATGVSDDDIGAVTALPDGQVGVFWSDQTRRRFGFRVHAPGAEPEDWSDDEVPGIGSALDVGGGMSDDHINFAVAIDGTLFVAVKTSYDTEGYTRVGLLVRRPSGQWDAFYHVDYQGTRPIVVVDESRDHLMVFYTSRDRGGDILYRESAAMPIRFGRRKILLSGDLLNNASSTKQWVSGSLVLVASTPSPSRVEGGIIRLR